MLWQINAESVFARGFVCLVCTNKALLQSLNTPEISALLANFLYYAQVCVYVCDCGGIMVYWLFSC